VRPRDAQRTEQAERVLGHVLHRIRRAYPQAQARTQGFPQQMTLRRMPETVTHAAVAVVVAQNTKTGIHERVDERIGPGDELHAQSHDQQHRGPIGLAAAGAGIFVFDGDAVGLNLHGFLRDRNAQATRLERAGKVPRNYGTSQSRRSGLPWLLLSVA